MSRRLQKHILESYHTNIQNIFKTRKRYPYLQIDDQHDYDNISEFCNIFINFKKQNSFEIELIGAVPITQEIADLAEIYQGHADPDQSKITLTINPKQIEAVADLASLFKKTALMGDLIGNPSWQQISARTIHSLQRFVRIIKEYVVQKQKELS